MNRRPLSRGDLPVLLVTLNAREQADDLPIRTPIDDLEHDLAATGLDLSRDSLGLFAADGACIAYGFVRCPPEPTPQFHPAQLHLVVHPDHAGRGIGRELLDWLLRRGQDLLADVEASRRIVTAGVDRRQVAAVALLERTGFTVQRTFEELALPLPDVAARTGELPPGYRVIGWDEQRSREAKGVLRGAFADHWGSTPVSEDRWQAMTAPPRFQPHLSSMAVRAAPDGGLGQDVLVGMVVVQLWPEDWEVTGRRAADIDVVAVARSARGRGLATAMIARTLEQSRRHGLTHATLGVDTDSPSGAHTLYARLGFRVVTQLDRWDRPWRMVDYPRCPN